MINVKKMLAGAGIAALLAAGSVAVAAPAQALNSVPCNNSNYLTIVGNPNSQCYANAGEQYISPITSRQLFAGNNAGFVRTSSNATTSFQKFQNVTYSLRTLNYARIY